MKSKPLPVAGESLEQRRNDLLAGEALTGVLLAVAAIVFAAYEWLRYAFGWNPHPLTVTACAALVIGIAVFRVRGAMKQARNMSVGLTGERLVAEALDQLKPRGYQVFHDIEGDGFNIDHVVVGPAGVFAIETKARTKPERGEARVTFDGDRILVNGQAQDRDPIIQARAGASDIGQRLRSATGNDYFVRPVVLFPDWFVEERRGTEVWVLNETRFLVYVNNERLRLLPEEVRRVSAVIGDFARMRLTHATT